ncbi:MAG: hypothetical protein KC931_22230, partial [Candidatus Omnitrophica bacterium]|nr:hypothetical protein [Candidatus Omnitrophota bacterium]
MFNRQEGCMRKTLSIFLITMAIGILSLSQAALAQKLYFEQQQEVTASDISSGDLFGWSASVDGDLAAFGSLGDDNRIGAVYLFRRSGTTWNEEAKLIASNGGEDETFGSKVDVSGDYVIVGAAEAKPVGHNSGSAYIFHTTGEGWVEQKILAPSDHTADDKFGEGVSISGDRAAAASRFHDDVFLGSGSVYVFVRNATDWVEEKKLNASEPVANGNFGNSIDLRGDRLIAGQPGGTTNTGKAFIFIRSATDWSEVAKLIPSDGMVGDEFGKSVAIDGNPAVDDSPASDTFGTSSGAAYVYVESATGWNETQKLLPPESLGGDQFGSSVAIDGDTIIVGADGTNRPESGSGAVYVFVKDGNDWVYEARWFVEDVSTNQTLGRSIALQGDTGVSGAIGDSDPGFFTGTGYIFSRTALQIPGVEPGSHVEG